jgi:hypothetical protein
VTARPCFGSGGDWASAGAPYLSQAVGCVWFEVEVVEAKGVALVGFAGTNFRGSGDALPWSVFSGDGKPYHGGYDHPPCRLQLLFCRKIFPAVAVLTFHLHRPFPSALCSLPGRSFLRQRACLCVLMAKRAHGPLTCVLEPRVFCPLRETSPPARGL